jgi:hypothetical protein
MKEKNASGSAAYLWYTLHVVQKYGFYVTLSFLMREEVVHLLASYVILLMLKTEQRSSAKCIHLFYTEKIVIKQ